MPSNSLETWRTVRAKALNEIVAAHRMVGGTGRGRRFATQQLNHAFAMLLSSQFQGFCRDLHTECVDCLSDLAVNTVLKDVLHVEFSLFRKLDKGNPNPGNIGADFNRFGFVFWDELAQHDSANAARKSELELLNEWRNAIAHQDFNSPKLGGIRTLHLSHVRRWRLVCDALTVSFDEVMRRRLTAIGGTMPW